MAYYTPQHQQQQLVSAQQQHIQTVSKLPPAIADVLAQHLPQPQAVSRKDVEFGSIENLYVREYLQRLLKTLLNLESGNNALAVCFDLDRHYADLWVFWVENLSDRIGATLFSAIYAVPHSVPNWTPISQIYIMPAKGGNPTRLVIEIVPFQAPVLQPTNSFPQLAAAPPPQTLYLPAAPTSKHRDASPPRKNGKKASSSSDSSASSSDSEARPGIVKSVARFLVGVDDDHTSASKKKGKTAQRGKRKGK